MRTPVFVAVLLIAFATCGCGSSSTPAGPSQTVNSGGGGGGSSPVPAQVYILGEAGGESFRPSPVTAAQGSTLVWINSDTEVHRIVAADGSFDTGDLAPDAQSAPIVVGAAGSNYSCAIHPSEVGSISAPK